MNKEMLARNIERLEKAEEIITQVYRDDEFLTWLKTQPWAMEPVKGPSGPAPYDGTTYLAMVNSTPAFLFDFISALEDHVEA